jgi:hypothetical protein
VESELSEVTATFHTDLETVRLRFGAEIAHLSNSVDRAYHSAATVSAAQPWVGNLADGPSGHRDELQHRGMACAHGTPPPAGGTHVFPTRPWNSTQPSHPIDSDALVSAPRVELPQFDGTNSKLWQRRCEEYFHRWDTPSSCWISYASSQFVGAAATWLEAFLTKCPQATWAEFVQAVQARFMRNQYQVLLRRLYRISQTSTVEEYVQQFSDPVDQISAYEAHPNQLNYLTRFLDGLRPGVRVLVAIQQPEDLDTAYTMALLYEELGDGCTPWNS